MSIQTYQDHLINQAVRHWSVGEPCPVDVIANLHAEGIDAAELERKFDQTLTEDEEDESNGQAEET